MQNQIPWWLQQSSGVGDILLIEWMTNMFLPSILGTSVHIVEVTLKLHLCPLVNMPLIDVNLIGCL